MKGLILPFSVLLSVIAGVLVISTVSFIYRKAQASPVKLFIILIAIVLALFGACVLVISGSLG